MTKLKGNDIRVYMSMYALTIIISIYAQMIDIGRVQWYLMFSICVILPTIVRAMIKTKFKYFTIVIVPLIILYGFIYSYRIVFVQSSNKSMTDYRCILFEDE